MTNVTTPEQKSRSCASATQKCAFDGKNVTLVKKSKRPIMSLSEKLRSAAKSPDDWDVPGLLREAADYITATDTALARFVKVSS